MRLPGTKNLPNKKKRETGRVPCEARLLRANGVVHPLDAFPPAEVRESSRAEPEPRRAGTPDDGGHHARQKLDDETDELWRTIKEGGGNRHGSSRSEAVWYAVNAMLRLGYVEGKIAGVLLDVKNKISEHVRDQSNPAAYAKRQIAQAKKSITFAASEAGVPYKTQNNMRIALLKLDVTVRYDQFADRTLIEGLDGFGPTLTDAAMNRLRLTIDQRFRFLPAKEIFFDVVTDVAQLNAFHPVRDYLAGLKWDRTARIDRWLTTYAGAEDNDYVRAVGALLLTAAVRRVRAPGCKYDEIVVFESDQGKNKSTALALLAVSEDWFSDDLPLNARNKEVIEVVRGR